MGIMVAAGVYIGDKVWETLLAALIVLLLYSKNEFKYLHSSNETRKKRKNTLQQLKFGRIL